MRPANAVIIGCGAIGPIHAAAVAQSESVKLYGVCDILEDRAVRMAEPYGCKVFTDLEQVLADPEVDSVHICTPHYLHAEMAIRAAQRGKHVVLEKPVSMNVAQARTVAEAVASSGIRCGAILQNRLNPSIEKAKQLVESGELGRVLGLKGILTWMRTPDYYRSEPWRGRWDTEGGGLLINQAVHMLDMMYYLGGDVEAVKGHIDTRVLQDVIEVEDTADATFYYKGGVRGFFFATNGYSTNSPFYLELHLERGTLRYMDNALILKGDGPDQVLARDDQGALGKSYWGMGHARAIGDFYRSLADGTDGYIALQEASCSMGMLDAIYASSKSGRRETVERF
ncbi:Gfo/Idh/MocA family protein [Gorillibacterium sp. sgz5001074]|uniref:Gfo/Idh/MocA family protein n=1 Tax=Gorillibacterium sp. sgz5001074 TaxID=3446695 RepID=UPI003F66A7F2